MPDGKSLLSRMVRRGFVGQLLLAALLFGSASTLKFWQGWAFMVASSIFPLFWTIYFYQRDPQLLERRLLKKEKAKTQKIIMLLMKLFYISALVLSGLDYRFGWSRAFFGPVPWWLTLLALSVILGCHLWFFWVLKANRFAASIIQVEAGQTVTAAGPYRFVRHPMYLGGVVLWLAAPLALGSYVALPAFAPIIPVLVFRLLNEEKILRRDLPGYAEYCRRTPCRLTPFVW